MNRVITLALISVMGFSIYSFENKHNYLLDFSINKAPSINKIESAEPTVESIVFKKNTGGTNVTVQAQSKIGVNTETTLKLQEAKQAETTIKTALSVEDQTVFQRETVSKYEKAEQPITEIKAESEPRIQIVDKTKATIKPQVAEAIGFQTSNVKDKGQKQSPSMLKSKQSVKQFYDELFEMPMVIKVLVNNELSSLGLFKVSQDGSVLLKEIYKGDIPIAVEDSLKLGINYIDCDGKKRILVVFLTLLTFH
ncbi:hypothetical protein [Shewanella japonica]|uniref:Energy transducer TonB n=1 Tax=Shewanella japonica TaxID=93973 RepID=A0ABM6JJT3_9GAMM|nr:hypothetical protein [Shewanella japonica]ARD22479.1 hypothetical protein SJ2017_2185 [Shewanella japonica]